MGTAKENACFFLAIPLVYTLYAARVKAGGTRE